MQCDRLSGCLVEHLIVETAKLFGSGIAPALVILGYSNIIHFTDHTR